MFIQDNLKNMPLEQINQFYMSEDYDFLLCYYAIKTVLVKYDSIVILDCIQLMRSDKIRQQLLIDLFSIMFLKNRKAYTTNISIVTELIPILLNFTKDPELKKCCKQAQLKIVCIGQNLKQFRDVLKPSESLVHSAILSNNWEIAAKIVEVSDSLSKFFLLYQAITQGQVLKDSMMYYAEMGFSSMENIEYLKKLRTTEFKYKTLSEKRILNKYPLKLFDLPKRDLQEIDTTLSDQESKLLSFHLFENSHLLNNFLSYLNIYIDVGASSINRLKFMKRKETLNKLIETKQFDLAYEFAGHIMQLQKF